MSDQTNSEIYILHGDDEYSMSRKVAELLKHYADPATADLNITRLNAAQASEERLRSIAITLPCLAERRVVVVDNPLARLSAKPAQEGFIAFLNSLPPTTVLILVIDDFFKNVWFDNQWQKVWQVLGEKHWLRKWANEPGRRASVRTYQLPPKNEMQRWIKAQAEEAGGTFTPDAASALAEYVGGDTRIASLEINKLLTYVDHARPVERTDVEKLTPYANPPDIFEMVDALAAGSGQQAQKVFHRLLEKEEPPMLFGMVVRQFRLLLQGRELLDEGGNAQQAVKEIAEINSAFVATKALRQAQRFRQADLERIYHRLLELDTAVKQGETSYELGIDLLIAEMAHK